MLLFSNFYFGVQEQKKVTFLWLKLKHLSSEKWILVTSTIYNLYRVCVSTERKKMRKTIVKTNSRLN